ncbi:MAG: hypothetical protein H0X33_13745 [Taibaiella sp.]|nr:hypothetical protein [Taibaiella sp.]
MNRYILCLICTIFLFSCTKQASGPGTLPDDYSNQQLGASAKDLLTAAKYTNVTIQVQYMGSYQPDATAINNTVAFLNSVCNKSGITFMATQIPSAGMDTLTLSNVELIEKQNRTAYTSGSTLALYILVTDGVYSQPNVLGVAYRNTSLCLFGKTIFSHSGGFGQISRLTAESTVLEHEMGHILGLVDLGTPMVIGHKDATNGNHCNNSSCLMYYATETMDMFGMLGMSSAPPLDANCVNDLQANGGK